MFKKAPWVPALLGMTVWMLALSAGAQPIGAIDTPLAGSTVSGIVRVSGFVLDTKAIDLVELAVDDVVVNHADTGLPRPDVLEIFPNYFNSPTANPGFVSSFVARGTQFSAGPHKLSILARESLSEQFTEIASVTVTVDNLSNQAPFGWIDIPGASGLENFNGSFPVAGWAIDDSGEIDHIDFKIDGQIVAGAVGRGQPSSAIYGSTRPDVQAAFPDVPFSLYTGFVANIDSTTLNNGSHILSVEATDGDGASREIGRRSVLVNTIGGNLGPFGRIDFPLDNASLFCIGIVGGFPSPCTPDICAPQFNNVVKGWALDVGSALDRGGVDYVELLLDGAIIGSSHDCIQVNGALTNCYGLNRPDVERSYSDYANADNAGFSFSFFLARDIIDISGQIQVLAPRESALPVDTGVTTHAGTHYLSIRAGDVTETVTTFGTMAVDILCDTTNSNQPAFGFIDAPSDFEFIDGIFEVLGWAYDFQVVSSVEIDVDGQVVGTATYGLSRPDVPDNDPRVPTEFVGFGFPLDTTALSDNEHDLIVFVIDRTGNRTEIGRRKFVVDNNVSTHE